MASTYTFTKKTPAKDSTGAGHYASQPVDGARIAIQGFANGIQTTDASSTAVTSPVTLAAAGTKTLNTPESAISLIINNTGAAAMTVSEVSSGSSFTLNAGQSTTLNCGNMGVVYTGSTSGTTFSFYYEIV